MEKEKIIDEEIVGKYFKQHCGDTLLVLNECIQEKGKDKKFKCQFQKYFYEIFATKKDIKTGTVINPQIEVEEFINKIWLQNCGDSVRILRKTNEREKNKSKNILFEIEFLKYPFKDKRTKSDIIAGECINPRIEIEEFIKKEWPQKCGDFLKILKKTEEKDKGGHILYECEFQKYPYKIKVKKGHIISGNVNNPRIEVEEFVNKLWPQNCGDTLKILRKTEEKGKEGHSLFEAEFQKYPCKIKARKNEIKKGNILNPKIEEEFVNILWPQNCGDILKIIRKTEEREIYINGKEGAILYECEFQKYPCIIKAVKSSIIRGYVDNPNFPWRVKENLQKYIEENFKEKPTLQEVANSLNVASCTISHKINKFELRNLIQYYLNNEQNSLKDYIESIYDGNIVENYYSKETEYKEADIYLPEKKIAIEYNGSPWHEEGNPNNKFSKPIGYHENKRKIFKKLGIKMYFIWDYEWFENFPKNTIISESCKEKVKNIIFSS